MNLPNKLTIIRICMVPLILVFLLPLPELTEGLASWNQFIYEYGKIVALVLFIIASLTDYFDGEIARKHNLITNLGKFLDPIADKMLVISVFIALIQTGRLSAIVAIVVIIREFFITGIRLMASDHGVVIAANNLGKAKTVSQIVAIIFVLSEPILFFLTGSFLNEKWITLTGDIIVWISVALTLISGINYIRENMRFFVADKQEKT